MSRAILITGATGNQGGAVVTALLAARADFEILALTRDPSSPSARRLAAKSNKVHLVQGNLDEPVAIFQKAREVTSAPIWGVFSMQTPTLNKTGPIIEQRQGKGLIDTALQQGVKYYIYSSVDRGGERSVENPTNVPHFASKHNIEHHLIASAAGTDMGWTILRPAAFMENFDGGFLGKVFATAWRIAVRSRPLQLVATKDIGVFAAKAFVAPESFNGKSISLAGDELTYEQMTAAFRNKTGSDAPSTWGLIARLLLWLSTEMGTMYAFFDREGYRADVEELRRMHPGLQNLSTWLDESPYVTKQE